MCKTTHCEENGMQPARKVMEYKEGSQYDFPVTYTAAKIGRLITAADGKTYMVMELSHESARELNSRDPNMLVLLQEAGWVRCMRAMWLRHRLNMLHEDQESGNLIFVPQQ